jgi:hypothetical protein
VVSHVGALHRLLLLCCTATNATAALTLLCISAHKVFSSEPGLKDLVRGLLRYEPMSRIGTAPTSGGIIAAMQATHWLQTVNWDAIAAMDPIASFVPPPSVLVLKKEGKLDPNLFDSAEEAGQEYREQEAFQCWLPTLGPADAQLFESLC